MSSPFRRPSPRNSPNNRLRRSQYGHPQSPSQQKSTASPQRQLAEELSRVYISDTKAFKHSLDLQDDEQEKLHRQALLKSLAEHEAIRESAERARQRIELEIERARKQLEDEERSRIEQARLKTEQEDRERKARETTRLQQLEVRRKAEQDKENRQREEQKREHARREEAMLAKQRLAEETAAKQRQDKEEHERKQAEAKAPRSPSNPVAATADPSLHAATAEYRPVLTPCGITSSPEQREAEHQRYMTMHKELKIMRKDILTRARDIPGMTAQISEARRTIKKKLGMLNAVDLTLNRQPTKEIRDLLDQASKTSQILVDPSRFIVSLDKETKPASAQYPGALLFLLNYLAKYILNRLTDHVARDPKSAEPYGIVTISIFATTAYFYNGHSLVDMLWAKYHKVCPVLFGIYGNDKTIAGKHRLGWRFEKDFDTSKPDAGTFVPMEDHLGNQAGLATGFAAITLRIFKGPPEQNPVQNRIYWTAMARVLSTPVQDRTSTHFVVARNMVELYVPRFMHFFGSAALAALRKMFKEWPSQAANKKDPNVLALDGLPRFFERDHNLYL